MRYLTTALIVTLGICLSMPQVGWAQVVTPPWPNGCSVGLPGWAQQGLDGIFNGACDNHDRCWAQCNGASGPYRGLQHRNQCDQTFLSELSSACALRAAQVVFPLGDIDDVGEFLAVCEGVALTMTTAVQTPIATPIYWRSQCLRGCNPMACLQAGLFFPTQDGRPPTCGTFPYTGPAFCYRQPYTPDICTFHLCPGFLVEPTSGKGKLSSEDESKPTLDLDTETFQGGECSSILDWYCCACQFCPNCLM